jgi:hypothetical protein
MAIAQAVCNSFKQQILEGQHNFKLAETFLNYHFIHQQQTYQLQQLFILQLMK